MSDTPVVQPTPSQLPPVIIEGSVVPPAVRAGGTRADELQAAYIAGLTQPGNAPVVTPQPQSEPAPEPAPVSVPDPAPAPAPAPAILEAEPPVEEPPTAEPGTPEAKWEHTARTWKGRFEAQRARDQQTINQLSNELMKLRRDLEARTATPTPSLPATSPMTDEEREAFGPELVDVIERVANHRVAEALKQNVDPRLNQLAEQTAEQREAAMVAAIDQSLAADGYAFGFDAVNTAQSFITWLQLTDPMSGVTRQTLLQQAWNSQHGSQVLAIVRSFLNETSPRPPQPAPVVTPASPAPVPPAPVAPRTPQISLASLAAPGTPRSPAPAQGPVADKPVYTRAEVSQFYAAKRRGVYAGREAEAQGYENEIFAAQREGRII